MTKRIVHPGRIVQPRGIKAFGWGLLGWFGTNIIINVTTLSGGFLGYEMGGPATGNGGHFLGFVLGMIFAVMFARSRDYSATSTGAWIAFGIQSLAFCAGLIS